MEDAYLTHFDYHHRPEYEINFCLVLNSVLKYCLNALVIKTKSYSTSAPENATQRVVMSTNTAYLTLHLEPQKGQTLKMVLGLSVPFAPFTVIHYDSTKALLLFLLLSDCIIVEV